MQDSILLSMIVTIFGSAGFWTFVSNYLQNKSRKDDAQAQMLKGLGHDRICFLGEKYLDRGYITKDEYENLNDYLFEPYEKLKGNGTAKKIMDEVKKLPTRGGKQ